MSPNSNTPDAADAPPVPAPRRGWAVCAWVAVALYVLSLGLFPLRSSHDEWWHLKTGKWIVDHHMHLPEKDVFAYTAANYQWDNHEWLSEAAMYQAWRWGDAHDLGGWRVLIVLKALLLVAAYLLLGRFVVQRAGGGAAGLAVATFVVVLAAAVGRRMFWPRPPVVSDLFLVFFLYVLWAHRSGRLRPLALLVLPLLMPLWANLHGGFLLGGVAVGAYAAGEGLEWAGGRLLARRPAAAVREQWRRAWTYAGVGVLCGLASLLNPFGYRVYLLSSRVMRDRLLVSLLSELRPPDFRFTWAFAFLWTLLVAAAAVLTALAAERAGRAGRAAATGGRRALALTAFFVCVAAGGAVLSATRFAALRSSAPADTARFLWSPVYALTAGGLAAAAGCLVAAWWARRVARAAAGGAAGGATAEPVAWPPLADLLLAGFFFAQALGHVRHLVLFGLAAAPLAAWFLARAHAALSQEGQRRLRRVLGIVAVVMAVWVLCLPGEAVGVADFGARLAAEGPAKMRSESPDGTLAAYLSPSQIGRNLQILRGQEYDRGYYPVEAADFVLRARISSDPSARLPGRLYNRNNISGYLIWKLSPEHYQVFTDSRFDIFGGDFLDDEMSVANHWTAEELARYYAVTPGARPGMRDWHEVVGQWDINLMVLEKGEEIHRYLARQCFEDWLAANAPQDLVRGFAQGDGRIAPALMAWLRAFRPEASRRPAAPASEWALLHADAGFAVWMRRAPGREAWTDQHEDWMRTVREYVQAELEAERRAAANGGRR